jgi:hypothetical protein
MMDVLYVRYVRTGEIVSLFNNGTGLKIDSLWRFLVLPVEDAAGKVGRADPPRAEAREG